MQSEEDILKAVSWFSNHMSRKLADNAYKGGWEDCDVQYLLSRIYEETSELEAALEGVELDTCTEEQAKSIIDESTDIANFAMMVADKARARLRSQHEYDGSTDSRGT